MLIQCLEVLLWAMKENTILSRTRVIKAGKTLIDKTSPEEKKTEALEILSEWRSYHAKPLDAFQKYIELGISVLSVKQLSLKDLSAYLQSLVSLRECHQTILQECKILGGIGWYYPQ